MNKLQQWIWDLSLSAYAEFSEKLTFFTLFHAFIQQLLAVAVFNKGIEFSNKGTHLQDKCTCS